MSKAVLLSIKPEWCDLIVSGQKKMEIRKTKPKINTPFKSYIYCSGRYFGLQSKTNPALKKNAAKKVIGEFDCSSIVEYRPGSSFDPINSCFSLRTLACVPPAEIWHYAEGKPIYGWFMTNLKIYDKPKNLEDFQLACNHKEDCGSCKRFDRKKYACIAGLTRPPMSWCYVEEIE